MDVQTSSTNSRIGKNYLPWVDKSISRTRKDMKSWNLALNQWHLADQPLSWMLQQLYTEIFRDATPAAQKANRDNQIFSSTFSLKNASGEIDEEQTALLKKHPLYRQLTQYVIDSEWFAVTVCELSFQESNGVKRLIAEMVPRENIVPQRGLFYPDYMDPSKFIKYREMAEFGTWILEFNSGHEGLANKLVAPVLLMRFAESCWSELCEIYGIPPRVLKTNTGDSKALARADKMMKDMGAAAYFIIDETEEFEFAKGVATNGDVYKNLINHLRDKICTLVSGGLIGQDTENGSRAKDEVVFDMLWLLVQSDMARVEDAWNNIIIPALVKHGVLKPGLTFEFDEAEDVGQLWKFVQGLIPFYEIDPEWIKKKFNIEITGPKDQSTAAAALALMFGGKGDPDFFPVAPQVGACCGNHHTIQLSLPKDAPKSEGLIERIGKSKGRAGFDPQLFWETSRTLILGLNRGLDGRKITLSMDFTYGVDDPHLLTSFELNLHRFSAGKTLAQVQALNEAFRNAKSYDIFKMNAKRIGDVWNEAWLKTEYDTATLVGEAATNYHNLMQDVETFPYWQYKIIEDGNARPEHAKLNGLILPANDPAWQKLFPPNGWNCRCYVIGQMEEEVEGVDFAAMKARAEEYFASDQFATGAAQGFGVNRAVTGEVFTANQQYITGKSLTETRKQLNELKPEEYGLKPYSEARKIAQNDLTRYEGTAADWLAQREVLQDVPTLYDYSGRAIAIDPERWAGNTTGNKAKRVELLDAIIQAMDTPDEVWIREGKQVELIYLKYYLEDTIAVIGKQNSDNRLELFSWLTLKDNESTINRHRTGLLIKK